MTQQCCCLENRTIIQSIQYKIATLFIYKLKRGSLTCTRTPVSCKYAMYVLLLDMTTVFCFFYLSHKDKKNVIFILLSRNAPENAKVTNLQLTVLCLAIPGSTKTSLVLAATMEEGFSSSTGSCGFSFSFCSGSFTTGA